MPVHYQYKIGELYSPFDLPPYPSEVYNGSLFCEKYGTSYLDEKVPEVEPDFGVQSFDPRKDWDLGVVPFFERGVLVSKKAIRLLSKFNLAPHVFYGVKHETIYDSNPSWNTNGEFPFLFFYSSLFNYVLFEKSTFRIVEKGSLK